MKRWFSNGYLKSQQERLSKNTQEKLKNDETRTKTEHTSTSPKSSTISSPSYEEQNFTAKKPQSLFFCFGTSKKNRPLCNSHPVRLLARFVRSLAVHLLEQPNKSLDLPEITKLDEVKNILTKIVKFRYIKSDTCIRST